MEALEEGREWMRQCWEKRLQNEARARPIPPLSRQPRGARNGGGPPARELLVHNPSPNDRRLSRLVFFLLANQAHAAAGPHPPGAPRILRLNCFCVLPKAASKGGKGPADLCPPAPPSLAGSSPLCSKGGCDVAGLSQEDHAIGIDRQLNWPNDYM